MGWLDYTLDFGENTSFYLDARLDVDGNGTAERDPGLVFLRQKKVSPGINPFAIYPAEGTDRPIPSSNFRLYRVFDYTTEITRVHSYSTIEALESRTGN